MKKIYFLLFLLFALNLAFAQNLNLGSLQKARNYNSIEAADTAGFRLVSIKEGYDLFALDGKKMTTHNYEYLSQTDFGYWFGNNIGGSWQVLLDENGKELFEYDGIKIWKKGLFMVVKTKYFPLFNEFSLVNAQNKQLIPFYPQELFPLYNANALPPITEDSLLPDSYKYYCSDSCIVLRNGKYFLYNLKNEQLAEIPFTEAQKSHGLRDYKYFLQHNKIILCKQLVEINGNTFLEWNIGNYDTLSGNIPVIRKVNGNLKNMYGFSTLIKEKNNGEIYHTISDENEKIVLEGEWKRYQSQIMQSIKGYLVVSKVLEGVHDTLAEREERENKPNINPNPLFQESCKKKEIPRDIWLYQYSLFRLEDRKEIIKIICPQKSYGYSSIRFWGMDKCVVEIDNLFGIMDLAGNWLVSPSFEEASIINEKILKIKQKGNVFLMNRNLEKKAINSNAEISNAQNGYIKVLKDKKKDALSSKQTIRMEIWNDFNPIYSEIVDYNPYSINWQPSSRSQLQNRVYEDTDSTGRKIGSVIIFDNGKTEYFSDKNIEVTPYHYIVEKNGKEGLIDEMGYRISRFVYDTIAFKNEYYECRLRDTIYYLDKRGKFLLADKLYTERKQKVKQLNELCAAQGYSEYNMLEVERYAENKFYFEKDSAYYCASNFIAIEKPKLYGYINKEGVETVPPVYNDIIKLKPNLFLAATKKVEDDLPKAWNYKINPYTGESTRLSEQDSTRANLHWELKVREFPLLKPDSLQLESEYSYKPLYRWGNYPNIVTNYYSSPDVADKYGILDTNYQLVVPIKYEYLREMYYRGTEDRVYIAQKHYYIRNFLRKWQKINIYDNNARLISKKRYSSANGVEHLGLRVRKKKRWGVISFQGKVIIPCIYHKKDSLSYYNDYDSAILVLHKQHQILYSEAGKTIWKGTIEDSVCRFGNVYVVKNIKQGEKWVSILDTNGRVKMSYNGYYRKYGKCLTASFAEEGKQNLLNLEGEWLMPSNCDSIKMVKNGYLLYDKGKMGMFTYNGKSGFLPENNVYGNILSIEEEDIVKVKLGDSEYYLHFDGTPYFPKGYNYYKMESKTVCRVSKNGKVGCIDNNGKIIVPLEWENVSLLKKLNLYAARQNCEYYLLDSLGKLLIPTAFEAILESDDKIEVIQDNKRGLLNKNGEVFIPCEYSYVCKQENDYRSRNANNAHYIARTMTNDRAYIIYSLSGEKRTTADFYTTEYHNHSLIGVTLLRDKELWGFYNAEKDILVPYIYKNISLPPIYISEKEQGFIVSLPNGKQGVIDFYGNTFLPIIYDKVESSYYKIIWDTQNREEYYGSFKVQNGEKTAEYYFKEVKWQWAEEK